jgi:hypothetical protein
MKHLTEEEFIDVLFEVPHDARLDRHLASCEACQQQLETLRLGEQAARSVEPVIPEDMPTPMISSRFFKRKVRVNRLTWVAAAAMFLLSVLGFRMEYNQNQFSMQFSLVGTQSSAEEERIAHLEQRLVEMIELNAELTQQQLDARFNALYDDRNQDIGVFSEALETKMKDLELANQLYLTNVKTDLEGTIRAQIRRR